MANMRKRSQAVLGQNLHLPFRKYDPALHSEHLTPL
jgi:hypothetical protein